MSDTLGEAQVDLLLAYRGTPRSRLFEYPHRDDDSRRYIQEAETLLDTILAAHPDNSTVEWGVRANWGGVSLHKSEGSARTAVAPGLYELVNRQSATEWQAAK